MRGISVVTISSQKMPKQSVTPLEAGISFGTFQKMVNDIVFVGRFLTTKALDKLAGRFVFCLILPQKGFVAAFAPVGQALANLLVQFQ